MKGNLALIVIAALPVSPIVIIVAGLVVAVVILVTALMLFRNSGKKKGANQQGASGASDWQRSQQQGMPGAWNAGQGMGAAPDAPWSQNAQPGGWGAPGAQNPAQAQQAAGGWGMPGAQGVQGTQQPGGWGASGAQAQGAQNPAQPAWGGGETALGGSPQAGWGMPTMQAAQPQGAQAGWNTPGMPGTQSPQSPAQPQSAQPGNWGATNTPNTSQPQPGMWGQQNAQGAGNNQSPWEAAASGPAQDAWQQQPAAPAWNATAPPAQQQQTAYGGSGSGQSWGPTGTGGLGGAQQQQPQPQADMWGQQPAQPAPQNAWGQTAQPAQSWGQAGIPGGQQPSPAMPGANSGMPAWQQPQQWGGAGMGQDATMMANEAEKTMLRSAGTSGFVRVEEGKEPGRVYEIRKEALSIGRSRESDIFLEDLAVSRLHASIVSLGNGDFALKDEGSANGTKVNGQVVNKYQTYPLKEGDKIQLGQTVLVFARR
ncbi:MAG TPA: FHA domain-containing protein [Ktedonobacteraceae bacterium]|nr:FHA domain-containing protein [Ktedonobacteraceae bacterium]